MTREDAVAILSGLEPSLRQQGIGALYLFGSVARGTQGSMSDLDLAFDLSSDAISFSLIDQSRIRRQLKTALQTEVDFVERAYLRPRISERASSDMIQIF